MSAGFPCPASPLLVGHMSSLPQGWLVRPHLMPLVPAAPLTAGLLLKERSHMMDHEEK